jgi:sodium/bile acid cotransporter 7
LLEGELATGVIVAVTVPCTLAAATVWTRRAGGNDAVAILVTLITNLACFFVAPAWLRLLVGTAAEVDYRALVIQLALLDVLPIAAAQVAQVPVATWAAARKRTEQPGTIRFSHGAVGPSVAVSEFGTWKTGRRSPSAR